MEEKNNDNTSVINSANIVHDKRENNKKRKIFLYSLIVVIVLLVASFIIFINYRKLNVLTFNDYDLYQYFSGVKIDYSATASITRDGNINKITTESGVENIEDAPIYYKDKNNEVLISKDMQLVIPRIKNKNYKLKYFTNIVYDEDSKLSYYMDGSNKIFLEESFLYDGNNLYLFLYDTSIIIDKVEYNLTPMSFIIVNYKGEIEMYNKLEDKYLIIDSHESDVLTTIGDITINLSTDMIMYTDDSRLLIKSVSNLPVYSKSE